MTTADDLVRRLKSANLRAGNRDRSCGECKHGVKAAPHMIACSRLDWITRDTQLCDHYQCRRGPDGAQTLRQAPGDR